MHPQTFGGKQFGQIVAEVQRLHEGLNESFIDMRRFGAPSECGAFIQQSFRKRLKAVLDAAGLTPAQFNETLIERTSSRWAYVNGLLLDNWEDYPL